MTHWCGRRCSEIEALEVYDTVSIGDQRVEAMHLQPCHSPIWDTALLMNALIETGMPQDHPSLQKAGAYLVSRQTKTVGDWKFSSPDAEPGGWYFQFENEFYPDVDDSAVVLMALSKVRMAQTTEVQESIRRGTNWVLAMQGSDGGWGAYDKDNNRIVFNYIPFADHHALLDPSTSDLTGRCLEMLAALGYDRTHPAVAPALRFLKREQEAGRQLVWPVGRELYLWHLVRSGRSPCDRRGSLGALYSPCGRPGLSRNRIPMAGGASRACPTVTLRGAGKGTARLLKRPGPSWDSCRRG